MATAYLILLCALSLACSFGYASIVARVSYVVNTFFVFLGIFCVLTGVKNVVKITTMVAFCLHFSGVHCVACFCSQKRQVFRHWLFFLRLEKNISLVIFTCLKCLKSLKRQKKKRVKKTFNAFYTRDRTPTEEKVEPEW